MIKIKGKSFRTVEVPDLCDRVYYGQTKQFTEEQYNSSSDLKKLIEEDRVLVISGNIKPETLKVKEVPEEKDFEEAEKECTAAIDPEPVIEKPRYNKPPHKEVKEKIKETNKEDSGEEIKGMLKELSKQVQESSTNNMLHVLKEVKEEVKRTVGGLNISGEGIKSKRVSPEISEEVFVPSSINVSDMSNHVSLESKSIGKGGVVNKSLAKLRELQKGKK